MTRETRRPLNRVTLDENIPSPVGLSVDARITDGGHHVDGAATVAGLNSITDFFIKKAGERKAEIDAGFIARGERDANLDTVDQQLVDDSDTYRKAVNKTSGQRQALEWYNTATQDLARAQREDPNMDFDTWRAQRIAELYGDDDDPDRLGAKNNAAASLEQNLRAQFEGRKAKAEHDQAANEWAGMNRAALEGGAVKSAAAIDALLAQAAPLGLTDEEARSTLAQQLAQQIELGDVDLYPILKDSKSQLHVDGEWGARLEKAHELGTKRKEAADAEAKLLKGADQLRAVNDINRLADRGGFGLAQALQYEGTLTNGFLTGAMERSRNAIERARASAERQAAKAEESMAKAQADAEKRATINAALSTGNAGNLFGSGIKQSEVQDVLDSMYFDAWRKFQSDDPNELQQAGHALSEAIDTARRNGLIPNAMKHQFDNADPSTPERFVATLKGYRNMRSQGLESYMATQISGKASALLETASDLVEAGMSPEDATSALKDRLVSDEAVNQAVNFNGRRLDATARALAGGSGKSTLVRQHMTPYLQAYLRTGDSYEVAEQKARKAYEKNFKTIGGWPMRTGDTPDEFADLANDWIDATLKPALAEKFGKDSEWTIAPHPNSPGTFVIVPIGGIGFLKGDDGQPVTINYNDLVVESAQRKQAANSRAHGRNTLYNESALRRHMGDE